MLLKKKFKIYLIVCFINNLTTNTTYHLSLQYLRFNKKKMTNQQYFTQKIELDNILEVIRKVSSNQNHLSLNSFKISI